MANVLIVDDEKSIRTTLAEFVKEDGHSVRTAENAPDALALLAEASADVVVTDIVLPRMDGMALLRKIHEESPETQVVVITGEPTVDTAAEAVRQGAFDYLAKPITGADIRAVVASAVRVKRMADDRRRLEEENLRYRLHLEDEVTRTAGELRASEARYRAVVEHAAEAIFIAQDGVLPFVNAAATAISGYSADDLRTRPFAELLYPDDRASVLDAYARQLGGGEAPELDELRMVRADGKVRWLRLRSVSINWEGRPALLNVARDVTERKVAEDRERLRRERTHAADAALLQLAMLPSLASGDLRATLQAIAETVADTIEVERVEVWLNPDGGGEVECAELFERTPRRHSSGRKPSLTVHPQYSAALRAERSIVADDARRDPRTAEFNESYFIPLGVGALIDVAVRVGGEVVGTFSVEHVGGPRAWSDEAVSFVNGVAGLVAVAVESAKRHETEQALKQSEAEYRALFEDSPASVLVEDFSGVKRRLDNLRERGVVDLEAYLDEHPEIVDDCIGAIRVVDANEAAVRLHRAASKADFIDRVGEDFPAAAKIGFRARLLAIWRGERVFETMTVDSTLDGSPLHTAIRWSIPPGHEARLDRVLLAKTDVTSVVEGEQRLRRTLDGVIEAIGRATESRDPYTAGHQRLVTDLAVAIAGELRLPLDVVDGIRAAGLLHDVGKLAIPAEILSKPSALSHMEMELMKAHPQAGYEILRTVDFPWPISQIVLEHHERLDGSGYPQGLRGEAIRIEARVLAVADVVEAMASHRPYRPALGIEAALAEVVQGRGTAYDADIVDACVRLFREGRFAFAIEPR
ncbi:MAG: response regulator [Candidatus Bipolaricaulis sp.]|nr:response regulator [Candidatus Bipolaricaulis sp.]MDD5646138.1 response regulator [Candidatus Bipolaricaulis sp.]